MTTLLGSLKSSASALNAHSRAAEVAGHNIQNAKNPHYARQRLNLRGGDTMQAGSLSGSLGVKLAGLQSTRSALLDKSFTREQMNLSSLRSQETVFGQIESNIGELIDRKLDSQSIDNTAYDNKLVGGLSKSVNDLFNAFQSLSASPNNEAKKRVLLEEAEMLTSQFHLAQQRLSDLDGSIGDTMATDITKANLLLSRIADLNKSIASHEFKTPTFEASDLRDERQEALEDLAQIMSFDTKVIEGGHGQIQVVGKDALGNSMTLVDGSNKLGDLSLNGTTVEFGSPSVALSLTGGSLHGNQQGKTMGVDVFSARLDAAAEQLVRSVNTAYNPTGATGDFFDATNLTAGTITIDAALTLASLKTTDTSNTGANELALAVGDLAEKVFSVSGGDVLDGTMRNYFTQTNVEIGKEMSSLSDRIDLQSTVESMIKEQRDAQSGVSVNEEVSNLLSAQFAFQGCSRVMNVINSMLEVIVNELVRR